ncbi:hypothetical protein [Cetobacterium somerae]
MNILFMKSIELEKQNIKRFNFLEEINNLHKQNNENKEGTDRKSFELYKKFSFIDNLEGIPFKNFRFDNDKNFEKELDLIITILSLCKFLSEKYSTFFTSEIENTLKNSISFKEIDNCLSSIFNLENEEFKKEFIDKFLQRKNKFLHNEFNMTIQAFNTSFISCSFTPEYKNVESKLISLDIPDKFLEGDIYSAIQNIKLLYKIESSFKEEKYVNLIHYNLFNLKKSLQNQREIFLSKINLEKYVDNNFFEITENKKIHIHNFNKKVSKIKVNKIIKEMEEIEKIIGVNIFDWNVINNLKTEVFYNLFNLIYIYNSPFFEIQSIDISNPLKSALPYDNISLLISSLLYPNLEDTLYIEGNHSWMKKVLTTNFEFLQELKNTVNQLEQIKEKDDLEKILHDMAKNSNANLKFSNLNEYKQYLKDNLSTIVFFNSSSQANIEFKKIKAIGFPLLDCSFETETNLNWTTEKYDKVFVCFLKDDINLIPEKMKLISDSGTGIFAVPESFLKNDEYREIRQALAKEKKINSIIRINSNDSQAKFKSLENYYLILIENVQNEIFLLDQRDLLLEIKGKSDALKITDFKKICKLKKDFNFQKKCQTINVSNLADIELDSIPFSYQNNNFSESIVEKIRKLENTNI